MTTPPPPPPKLRAIVAGVLVAALATILLCSASSTVKLVGAPFLILPRVLGLLETVRSSEIVTIPMDNPPTGVTFPRPEAYAVYVSDIGLLEATNQIAEVGAPPWLVIQRAPMGESIPVGTVARGLLPYDDPRVPGRPVLSFEIVEPGDYALSHPRRDLDFYLVPDRTTGREGVIAASFIVQVGLLLVPLMLVFGRPWLARRRSWRAHQRVRREASDAAMRRAAERRAGGRLVKLASVRLPLATSIIGRAASVLGLLVTRAGNLAVRASAAE